MDRSLLCKTIGQMALAASGSLVDPCQPAMIGSAGDEAAASIVLGITMPAGTAPVRSGRSSRPFSGQFWYAGEAIGCTALGTR